MNFWTLLEARLAVWAYFCPLRCQYASSEVQVRWHSSGNTPPPSCLCCQIVGFLKLTIWHSHPLHALNGQLSRGERRARVWSSFSRSLLLFLAQLFLSVFMWTTEFNTMNAFICIFKQYHTSPPYDIYNTILFSNKVVQHIIRTHSVQA